MNDGSSVVQASSKNMGMRPQCFIFSSEIATFDRRDADKSELVAFPGVRFVAKLHAAADSAMTATQLKYLVLRSDDRTSVRLHDRDTETIVRQPEENQIDISADTLATYSRQGELRLVRLREDELLAKTILPPSLLLTLRTASVSLGLEAIILAIRGDAGLFRVAGGTQVMPFKRWRGAWFADDSWASCSLPFSSARNQANAKGTSQTGLLGI
jgi:hypothetical protein